MRETLVRLVSERAGLDEGKAGQAVDAILGFFKENPDKIKELAAGQAGGLGGKLGHLLGR